MTHGLKGVCLLHPSGSNFGGKSGDQMLVVSPELPRCYSLHAQSTVNVSIELMHVSSGL